MLAVRIVRESAIETAVNEEENILDFDRDNGVHLHSTGIMPPILYYVGPWCQK